MENDAARKIIQQLLDALAGAVNHLNYCNWGDSWERGARPELEPKLTKATVDGTAFLATPITQP